MYVQLSNLFDEDKNYHGKLNRLLDLEVKVCLDEHGKDYINTDAVDIELNTPVLLSAVLKSNVNDPEWFFKPDGFLRNITGGLYKIDGKFTFLKLFYIDCSHLLNKSEWKILKDKEKRMEERKIEAQESLKKYLAKKEKK